MAEMFESKYRWQTWIWSVYSQCCFECKTTYSKISKIKKKINETVIGGKNLHNLSE